MRELYINIKFRTYKQVKIQPIYNNTEMRLPSEKALNL